MQERTKALIKGIVCWAAAAIFLLMSPDFDFLLFQTFPVTASQLLKITAVVCVILGFMYMNDARKLK